ncbi:uncharacterized protein MYCFIDRAFT_176777 [Pseudocercospora fijiensis CIRAD86]|uniref:Uncharacterized protein n=1 Tax=Pseudocercospora fijiensis (strain CIRAD86) TaxID=383855 RepID=M3AA43_PSEFD|nr:uncharacterized protein MYCFIDRAFT_176777 [Pseudocercospora fijiensis CIRAD86]EME81496.1 hypothetical protein MYCFIDRAFT_176777 [Pseudocercospora fijiensis CIRAD86]
MRVGARILKRLCLTRRHLSLSKHECVSREDQEHSDQHCQRWESNMAIDCSTPHGFTFGEANYNSQFQDVAVGSQAAGTSLSSYSTSSSFLMLQQHMNGDGDKPKPAGRFRNGNRRLEFAVVGGGLTLSRSRAVDLHSDVSKFRSFLFLRGVHLKSRKSVRALSPLRPNYRLVAYPP